MARRAIDLTQPLSRESQLHPFFPPTQILRHIQHSDAAAGDPVADRHSVRRCSGRSGRGAERGHRERDGRRDGRQCTPSLHRDDSTVLPPLHLSATIAATMRIRILGLLLGGILLAIAMGLVHSNAKAQKPGFELDGLSFGAGFGAALVLAAIFRMMPEKMRWLPKLAIVGGIAVVGIGLYLGYLRKTTGMGTGPLASPSAIIQDARATVEGVQQRQREREAELRAIQAEATGKPVSSIVAEGCSHSDARRARPQRPAARQEHPAVIAATFGSSARFLPSRSMP